MVIKRKKKDTLTNTTIKFNSNPLGIQFPDEKYEQYKGYQYLIPFLKNYSIGNKKTRKNPYRLLW